MAVEEVPAQTHTSLLSLPPEIRNVIYDYVVKAEWGHTSQEYFVLDRALPALFRASRQIRSEALDVFLLKNHFHVYTCNIGRKWLDILRKDVDRFRFLVLFVDLNLNGWRTYLTALLPLVSEYLELRIRKAAASMPYGRMKAALQNTELGNQDRWTLEETGSYEIVYRRIQV